MDSWLPWVSESSSLWLRVGVVAAWIALIGLLAETLHRYAEFGSETTRKVVHIGVGNVILFAWWLKIPAWIGIAASIAFGAIAFLSYRFPILPSINSVGRKSLGTFFYAISIGILIAAFWEDHPYYAVLGILVMTWGDGLAAIIGQRFGQHPYKVWGMQKSWEGSLTMAIVSYLVSSLVLLSVFGNVWQTWTFPIAIALVATVLEGFSKFGIDNLTVPLASATVGFVLEQVFPFS